MNEILKLKLDVEPVRHSLAMALSKHHKEIEGTIEAQLKEIDIAAMIAHEVRMSTGPIVSATVRACIEESVKAVIHNWEMHQQIQKAVTAAVIESMNASLTKEKP